MIRIAAGEVVERAASMVKELVENAVDAGADRILISLSSRVGRLVSVTVTDDGCGMDPGDARLAFARYATSKISGIDDLSTCRSLGFRGEALASIASVARVTLVTKSREGPGISGTKILNHGGEIIAVSETGCPAGTMVTVEDLFSLTPARMKFQKPAAAEVAYIAGIIEHIAIAHPWIAFELEHNDRRILSVPGSGDLMDTIIHLFGLPLSRQLVRVHGRGKRVIVEGYISEPSLARKNQYQMYLSVNRRSVRSRALTGAVRESYGTLLPAGRYPVVFLDLTITPAEVDPNVHPTKTEVRLSQETEIRDELVSIIKKSLAEMPHIPAAGFGRRAALPQNDPGSFRYAMQGDRQPGVREPLLKEQITTSRQLNLTGRHAYSRMESRLPDLDILGQLGSLYLIASTPEHDLLIIDQHAAHERVLYEQVLRQPGTVQECQELLEPVVLTLSPGESEILTASLPLLAAGGFSIDEFGQGTFLVRAVPVLLGQNLEPGEIQEIIAEIIAPGTGRQVDAAEEIRRIVACRGAIKAGALCTRDQCRQLLEQLGRTDNPYTCPHGRPTMVVFRKGHLDELFKRT